MTDAPKRAELKVILEGYSETARCCGECAELSLKGVLIWYKQEIAKARRSERLEVALDNYRGQTFSESTDYKSKFDKFVRNNEIRIEQLTLKEHKEGK